MLNFLKPFGTKGSGGLARIQGKNRTQCMGKGFGLRTLVSAFRPLEELIDQFGNRQGANGNRGSIFYASQRKLGHSGAEGFPNFLGRRKGILRPCAQVDPAFAIP